MTVMKCQKLTPPRIMFLVCAICVVVLGGKKNNYGEFAPPCGDIRCRPEFRSSMLKWDVIHVKEVWRLPYLKASDLGKELLSCCWRKWPRVSWPRLCVLALPSSEFKTQAYSGQIFGFSHLQRSLLYLVQKQFFWLLHTESRFVFFG